jgi:hypothetical protein
MRNKTDYILALLDGFSKQFKLDNNGILNSNFTKGSELINMVKYLFYHNEEMQIKMGLTTWGGETSEVDFKAFFNTALREFMASTTMEASSSKALKKTKKSWLKVSDFDWDKGPTDSYRERYFKFMSLSGRSPEEIMGLKKSTFSILEGFGNPAESGSFFKRGMVVGSVQSGKTANFNGVINSSIDMGYRLIIVLSGIMEDLRSQTQIRLEKEVLGPLVGQDYIGVGKVCRMEPDIANGWIGMKVQVNSVTSRRTDFNQQIAAASAQIEKTNILVVKKNVSVLKNILLWLNGYVNDDNRLIKVPLLIIDDEADNASLNNMGHKGKDYATKINQEIRAILGLFEKKTYVGYTATPFANILQYKNDEPSVKFNLKSGGKDYFFDLSEDLFPDDFIELLYPSSQYIGIKQFFDTKLHPPNLKLHSNEDTRKIYPLIAKPIPDTDFVESFPPRFFKDLDFLLPTTSKERGTRAATKYDPFPVKLPESLKEAVRCYILAIAVRNSREGMMIDSKFYQPHNTMLVHISRFGEWQNKTKELLIDYLNELSIQISKGYSSPIFELFRFTWDYHYSTTVGSLKGKFLDPNKYQDDYMRSVDFESTVKSGIARAIDGIEVRAINSSNQGQNLVYPAPSDSDFEPKKYIAIGGNRLSRGFTLEGLTINYFLRVTDSADTLMQMGRWFGYRIGYLDCCKLFTIRENIEKFNEASLIMEDLEIKFEQLAKLPDKTPKDFTIWIRNNPDIIKLTRVNFLRNLKIMSLDFAGRIQQSSQFSLERQRIVDTCNSFRNLSKGLVWEKQWDKYEKGGFVTHNTDQAGLIRFLDFAEMEGNTMLNINIVGLRGYLDECKKKGKLTKWIIAVKHSGEDGDGSLTRNDSLGLGIEIKQTVRRGPAEGSNAAEFLFDQNIFKVKNAQIISASDFSIGLLPSQKIQAVEEFKKDREQQLLKTDEFRNDPLGAKKKASKTMVPDYQYRKFMSEDTGILLIYPLDLSKVFETNDNFSSSGYKLSLNEFGRDQGLLDLNIPLIGFALGFPDIRDVEGGNFVTRHLIKDIEEMTVEELKVYVTDMNISIDLTKNWDKRTLLQEIIEIEGASGEEEFDDELIDI